MTHNNPNTPAIAIVQKRITQLEGSITTTTTERNRKVSAIQNDGMRISTEHIYNRQLDYLQTKLDVLNEVLAELQALPVYTINPVRFEMIHNRYSELYGHVYENALREVLLNPPAPVRSNHQHQLDNGFQSTVAQWANLHLDPPVPSEPLMRGAQPAYSIPDAKLEAVSQHYNTTFAPISVATLTDLLLHPYGEPEGFQYYILELSPRRLAEFAHRQVEKRATLRHIPATKLTRTTTKREAAAMKKAN